MNIPNRINVDSATDFMLTHRLAQLLLMDTFNNDKNIKRGFHRMLASHVSVHSDEFVLGLRKSNEIQCAVCS